MFQEIMLRIKRLLPDKKISERPKNVSMFPQNLEARVWLSAFALALETKNSHCSSMADMLVSSQLKQENTQTILTSCWVYQAGATVTLTCWVIGDKVIAVLTCLTPPGSGLANGSLRYIPSYNIIFVHILGQCSLTTRPKLVQSSLEESKILAYNYGSCACNSRHKMFLNIDLCTEYALIIQEYSQKYLFIMITC